MSNKQDLVVKMTINSNDFEKGIKNAKSQMKGMERTAKQSGGGIEGLVASAKKIVPAIAAAVGAFKGLEKAIRSTEQGSDALDRSIYAAKSSVEKFFQSISTGNLSNFVTDLNGVVTAAREAYTALDNLGTIKMWTGARADILKAQIAEQRVITNSKSATKAEKDEASRLIELYVSQLESITDEVTGATKDAVTAHLRSMAGGVNKYVNDRMLEDYVYMFEEGTLKESAQSIFDMYATVTKHSGGSQVRGGMAGGYYQTYDWNEVTWASEEMKAIYTAMNNLATVTENSEYGWKTYYQLLREEAAIRKSTAQTAMRAESSINQGSTGGGGGVTNPETVGLTDDQKIEYMNRAMIYASVFAHEFDKAIEEYTPFIEAEDIVEEDTDMLVASIAENLNQVKITGEQLAQVFGSVSDAFGNLTGMMSDDSPMKAFITSAQAVTSAAASMISTYTTLAGAATAAGAMESGESLPWPYNLIAIASFAATAIGTLATIKNAFAGSFANGGIVGGNSYSGDKLIARVNSGEMILNRSQQSALFGNGGGNVHFIIEGSQLKGVLDNYNKTNTL